MFCSQTKSNHHSQRKQEADPLSFPVLVKPSEEILKYEASVAEQVGGMRGVRLYI